MCFGDGGAASRAEEEAQGARDREIQRGFRIKEGTESINQNLARFDDKFLSGREKAFTEFQLPQLNQQFSDAAKKLTTSLFRTGNGASSVFAKKLADLKKQRDLAEQGIQSKGREFATQTANDIEGTRNELFAQINATADPASAQANSLRRAKILDNTPAFSPLAQVFANTATSAGVADKAFSTTDRGRSKTLFQDIFSGGSGRVVS